ncbi:S1 RNA binding domain-containing protein [Micromonospora coriariae]|uniref:S1 RNA binding domain-containing protein n=1 Tax=Micromonospora coriariae TaxID=285665 RepID=A0A1C4U313_9ACTN|nr:S1 RNA-binding domain-containing protein [Micromonospora coriariae]SCE66072.1 S1 RNA binding domain-containing protein [Micromonospora coriariae]
MSELHLLRDERPIEGRLFFATPWGKKELPDGSVFDFNAFYENELKATAEAAGFTPVRADNIYGPQSVMGPIWRGIQQAEIVAIDFTLRNPNVAMEYMMAMLIGKRCVYLTQDPDDIPTDVRGRLRYIRYSDRYQDVSRMREELRNQLIAIRSEPAVEMALVPMAAGGTDPVPATVITVTSEFAVIEASGGRRGVLGNADVDYNRIVPDMTRLYSIGTRVTGAFDVDTGGGMKYTLLAGTPNPWPRLRTEFPSGTTISGTVRRTRDGIGAFVEVGYGIDGLIHTSALAGRTLSAGDQVVASVIRVDADRRRISLALDRVVNAAGPPTPLAVPAADLGAFRLGQRLEAEVVKVVRQGDGGYLLVQLPDRRKPAMLHSSAMSPELREGLTDDDIEVGEIIDVEVLRIDTVRDRITVRDLPETAS